MRLTDILRPDCIRVPLRSDRKQAAIDEMIDLLAEQGRISDSRALKQSVWERENTRTTGIGHGLAIPHGKGECCHELVMAVGKPEQPIDFDAIDNKPVNVLFLLAAPLDQTGPHIQALARISRLMTDERFRTAVQGAASAQQLYDLIAEREETVHQ